MIEKIKNMMFTKVRMDGDFLWMKGDYDKEKTWCAFLGHQQCFILDLAIWFKNIFKRNT